MQHYINIIFILYVYDVRFFIITLIFRIVNIYNVLINFFMPKAGQKKESLLETLAYLK